MFVELCMCSIIYIIMNFEYKKLVFNDFKFVCVEIIYCIFSIIMLIKLSKFILRKCK